MKEKKVCKDKWLKELNKTRQRDTRRKQRITNKKNVIKRERWFNKRRSNERTNFDWDWTISQRKNDSEKKIDKLENNFSLSFSQNSVYLGYQFFLQTSTCLSEFSFSHFFFLLSFLLSLVALSYFLSFVLPFFLSFCVCLRLSFYLSVCLSIFLLFLVFF